MLLLLEIQAQQRRDLVLPERLRHVVQTVVRRDLEVLGARDHVGVDEVDEILPLLGQHLHQEVALFLQAEKRRALLRFDRLVQEAEDAAEIPYVPVRLELVALDRPLELGGVDVLVQLGQHLVRELLLDPQDRLQLVQEQLPRLLDRGRHGASLPARSPRKQRLHARHRGYRSFGCAVRSRSSSSSCRWRRAVARAPRAAPPGWSLRPRRSPATARRLRARVGSTSGWETTLSGRALWGHPPARRSRSRWRTSARLRTRSTWPATGRRST